MLQWLMHSAEPWARMYSDSAVLRTAIGFAHVAGLVAGGGSAIAADRSTLIAWRRDASSRAAQVAALHGTHRVVLGGLALVVVSGVLLLGADLDTYLHSRIFWLKMALVVLLFGNGSLLVRAGRDVRRGNPAAWRRLRYGAMASVCLWLLTTLLGTALPNV